MPVCLNMIVKDEAQVIRRCLESVLPFVDSWAILDTGSTDGTQQVIQEVTKGKPGLLVEGPWKGFAASRNEALAIARACGNPKYILFLDADARMTFPEGFQWPNDKDAYYIQHRMGDLAYYRFDLVSTALEWEYRGEKHEAIHCLSDFTHDTLRGPVIWEAHEGARSRDPTTWEQDARDLEAALERNPGDTRAAFYLAQSYLCAGDRHKALASYLYRAGQGGWEEEVYQSLYQAARILEDMNIDESIRTYLLAYEYRPTRAEAIGRLANLLDRLGRHPEAALYRKVQHSIPFPSDLLFLEPSFYKENP